MLLGMLSIVTLLCAFELAETVDSGFDFKERIVLLQYSVPHICISNMRGGYEPS
jgi:hypothetical protein